MLLTNTYVGPSGIHGNGLFVNEDLAAGTIIWQFHKSTCQAYFKRLFLSYCYGLNENELREALNYSYVRNGVVYKVLDNTKFINHSLEPNIAFLDDKTMMAITDIKAGSELFENYISSYDPNDFYYLDYMNESNKEDLFHNLKTHLMKFEVTKNQDRVS